MIELLVVIVIIAILAGLLLPAVIGGFKKAEITEVQTTERLLEMAIQAYYNDYGKYPGQNGPDDSHQYVDYYFLIATLRGSNLVGGSAAQILANPKGYNWKNQNPKMKVYLDISDKNIYTNTNKGSTPDTGVRIDAAYQDLQDPWGNRYMVVADWNHDGLITADGEQIRRTIAVWSWGSSNKTSASSTEPSHIRSWR